MIKSENSYFQNLRAKIGTPLLELFTLLKIVPIIFQSFSNIINIMLNRLFSIHKKRSPEILSQGFHLHFRLINLIYSASKAFASSIIFS